MKYGQKSKIKKLVNSEGFRISADAYDGIDRLFENVIKGICKQLPLDGVKTVDIRHTQLKNVAVNGSSEPKTNSNGVSGLSPDVIKLAKYIQKFCDENVTGYVGLSASVFRTPRGPRHQ